MVFCHLTHRIERLLLLMLMKHYLSRLHLGEFTEPADLISSRGPPEIEEVYDPVNEDLFEDIPEDNYDQNIMW